MKKQLPTMFPVAAISLRCLIGIVVCVLGESMAVAQVERFDSPQTMYVAEEEAEVRSGPGDDYYPTSTLPMGQPVEVHLRTADGWLGIRPPEGSYSWIPARAGYLLPGGRVVEIMEPETVCWIGSEVASPELLRWQVALGQGEQLVVLGEAHRQRSDGSSELWYRVAPPSAEFRWIHRSQCAVDPPPPGPAIEAAEAQVADDQRAMGDEPARIPADKRVRRLPRDTATASRTQRRPAETRQGAGQSSSAVRSAGSVAQQSPGSEVLPAQFVANQGGAQEPGYLMAGEQYSVMETVEGEQWEYASDPLYEEDAPLSDDPLDDPEAWRGWHAFDFELPQWHFPILRRLFSSPEDEPAAFDPLADDPYSLEVMRPPRRSPMLPPPTSTRFRRSTPRVATEQVEVMVPRRQTPWRDPAELRRRRLEGRLGDAPAGTDARSILEEIQDNLSALGTKSTTGAMGQLGMPGRTPMSGHPVSGEISTAAPRNPGAMLTSERAWYGVGASGRAAGVESVPALESVTATSATGRGEEALAALQIALSQEVAKPTGAWNLAPLRTEIVRLIEHGDTPLVRGQARLLLERLEEFQGHASRTALLGTASLTMRGAGQDTASFLPIAMSGGHAPVGAIPDAAPAVGSAVVPAAYVATAKGAGTIPSVSSTMPVPKSDSETPVFRSRSTATVDGQIPFDATGILVPVYAGDAAQPRYALAGSDGHIIAYVTPLAGMKLDHHLHQPVGVYGLRGYLPQLQALYIQAERVVRLP
ncbi:MAG: hypothetical protein KatS3mg111_2693 [Pirellulaceae bacterium]|nr:MAG: hypothetical protein KatS3mg111_2693 [Pirellulaceae bacterium]